MRSPSFITEVEPQIRRDAEKNRAGKTSICLRLLTVSLRLCVSAGIFIATASAQRVAVITPDKRPFSAVFSKELASRLTQRMKVVDEDLAMAAYRSVSPATPFNLSADEAKRLGAVIGCDAFIILRAETQRRSSSQRNTYYETAAPIYVISSRTGHLLFWKLQKFEGSSAANTEQPMFDSAGALATEVAEHLLAELKREIDSPSPSQIEEVPEAGSPEAKDFRAPIPYRRLKPDYTAEAVLYDITATVDILVDTDAAGSVTRTEIARWAGYGLDESVEHAVRQMNWRPAERNGKTLPMRFLLRYNFKKLAQ